MAIGSPLVATPIVGAVATTVTTASFTPGAGEILLALGSARGSGGSVPVISDSLGETWTPIIGSTLTTMRSRLFWKPATAVAQTVTVSSPGATQTAALVIRLPGVSSDFSKIKVDAHATVTTRSLTMDPFAATSGCIYIITSSGTANWATIPGYVEINDTQATTNLRVVWGYDISAPATSLSSLGGGIDSTMYGLEIQEAGAPVSAGLIKFWNGSTWAEKPMKVWTGSAWVTKPVKSWNGSAWV